MKSNLNTKKIDLSINQEHTISDANFVDIISSIINREISITAKERFLSIPDIYSVQNQDANIQRIIINKALMIELLKWRAHNDVAVYDVIGFLHNDGELEEWTYNFVLYVIPFLRKHNILGV